MASDATYRNCLRYTLETKIRDTEGKLRALKALLKLVPEDEPGEDDEALWFLLKGLR